MHRFQLLRCGLPRPALARKLIPSRKISLPSNCCLLAEFARRRLRAQRRKAARNCKARNSKNASSNDPIGLMEISYFRCFSSSKYFVKALPHFAKKAPGRRAAQGAKKAKRGPDESGRGSQRSDGPTSETKTLSDLGIRSSNRRTGNASPRRLSKPSNKSWQNQVIASRNQLFKSRKTAFVK